MYKLSISLFAVSFICIMYTLHNISIDLSCLKQEFIPQIIKIQTFIYQL